MIKARTNLKNLTREEKILCHLEAITGRQPKDTLDEAIRAVEIAKFIGKGVTIAIKARDEFEAMQLLLDMTRLEATCGESLLSNVKVVRC